MNICMRFITDGIRDTLAYYHRDDLPLHRLSWELQRRIEEIPSAVPHAPAVWIDQLRDLQRRVAEVEQNRTPGPRTALTDLEHRRVDDSLRQLQAVLELAHA